MAILPDSQGLRKKGRVDLDTEKLIALDKRFSWHPFTQMADWCAPGHEPLVLVEGKGAVLTDSRGREYLDGNASIWTNVHGHGHPKIVEAIREQAGRLAHASFLGTTNVPATLLAEKLVSLFPGGELSRVFFSDDGSTAMECAMKMALQYRQLVGEEARSEFVAFDGAYHGDTFGAAALGGIGAFHARFERFSGLPVRRCGTLEDLPEDGSRVAAVAIEPLIQGANGMRMWPEGMLRGLREWCDRNGAHLILDEVMTGFGRTGTMFACEREGVVPDFIALAKGLTGGTMPLAATLTTEAIYEAFLGEFEEMKTFFYGHSYSGNPMGCAAALASLAIFEEEGVIAGLGAKIERLGEGLERLRAAHPAVTGIRQCGMIGALDLGGLDWRERTGARVCEAAREHGLLTRPVLDTLVLMPPLCVSGDELDRMVGSLGSGIADVLEK